MYPQLFGGAQQQGGGGGLNASTGGGDDEVSNSGGQQDNSRKLRQRYQEYAPICNICASKEYELMAVVNARKDLAVFAVSMPQQDTRIPFCLYLDEPTHICTPACRECTATANADAEAKPIRAFNLFWHTPPRRIEP